MQNIEIKNGQNFLDVVLEATGDLDNVLIMAWANDLSITDSYEIGKEYKVVGKLNKNNIANLQLYIPATGSEFIEDLSRAGISFWAINRNFIVS